jgi:hypothetical protein
MRGDRSRFAFERRPSGKGTQAIAMQIVAGAVARMRT